MPARGWRKNSCRLHRNDKGESVKLRSLAELYEYNNFVINANTDGVTNEESLQQPQTSGNCMNWVLGHIVRYRNDILKYAGGEVVMDAATVPLYDNGSAPITSDANAAPFDKLLAHYRESHERLKARFEVMNYARLDQDAGDPGAPGKTVGQMLAGLMFHEAYHAGQLGVLRRVIGKEGALK